jgi:hypothetical protein
VQRRDKERLVPKTTSWQIALNESGEALAAKARLFSKMIKRAELVPRQISGFVPGSVFRLVLSDNLTTLEGLKLSSCSSTNENSSSLRW